MINNCVHFLIVKAYKGETSWLNTETIQITLNHS